MFGLCTLLAFEQLSLILCVPLTSKQTSWCANMYAAFVLCIASASVS